MPEEAPYKHILLDVEDGDDAVRVVMLTGAGRAATNAAPASVAIAKRLLWEGITETMAKEKPRLARIGKQPDAAEGVRSFLERRPPEWQLSASTDLPEWPGDSPGKDER